MSCGSHVMVDIKNFFIDSKTNAFELMTLARGSIIFNSTLRIVGSKLVIFDGLVSEEDFTFVLLLDASHFSFHYYEKQGICAIDCFTCGINNPEIILDDYLIHLKNIQPNLKITKKYFVSRFNINEG